MTGERLRRPGVARDPGAEASRGAATESDEERTRLQSRSYQWLTRSQRRRLQVLDARAVLVRYPWLARAEAARHASRPPTGRSR
jgi:hypothetical protein